LGILFYFILFYFILFYFILFYLWLYDIKQYTMSTSDLYIDSVYLSRISVPETGSRKTSLDGIANASFSSTYHTDDSQTVGYKWIISIVNKSATTFDLGTAGIKVKMIGQYYNNSDIVTTSVLTPFQIPIGLTDTYYFPGNGRYNIGSNEYETGIKLLEGVDIQVDTSNFIFSEDAFYDEAYTENAKIWATTRFELSDGSDTVIDVCGTSATSASPDESFVYSILSSETYGLGHAYYENNVYKSWKSGTLSRSSGTYPSATFIKTDWTPSQHTISSVNFLTSLEHGVPEGLTSPTDFYIDSIYYDKVYADTTQPPYNGLQSLAVNASISTSYISNNRSGYRWIVQVVNSSGSSITLSSTKRLRIKMIPHVINTDDNYEAHFPFLEIPNIVGTLDSGTIGAGESVYFGYNSLFGGVSVDVESTYVIPDTAVHDATYTNSESTKIWATTTIGLVYDIHGEIDIVGFDTHTESPDKSYTHSVISSSTSGLQRAVDEDTLADSWVGGSYNRTAEVYPTSTFDTADWSATKEATDTELLTTLHVSGDPHITTFYGEDYDFDYFGAFRLLDTHNPIPEQRLIINGQSDYGEGDKWNTLTYVRYIFISLGSKYIVIDAGFRGTKASVIKNKGFDNVKETELTFDDDADVSCWDCSFTTKKEKKFKINKHCNDTQHTIKEPVRNKLEFNIILENETIEFTFENVNEKNLQPCRLSTRGISHKHLKNASGCLIHSKYALTSGLKNIKSLNEPFEIEATFENKNIISHTRKNSAMTNNKKKNNLLAKKMDNLQITNKQQKKIKII
jgi:hypothetical protein